MDANNKGLRFEIGRNPNKDFKVLLGDEDITDRLLITRLEVKVDPKEITKVKLELIPDGVCVIAGHADVTFLDFELYEMIQRRGSIHHVERWFQIGDFEMHPGWYFLDENADHVGPYISHEAAERALHRLTERT